MNITQKNIKDRIYEKREDLKRKVTSLERELETVNRELGLLDELLPDDTGATEDGQRKTAVARKVSLIELARQVLQEQPGEKMVSSEIANRAVDKGLWVDPPPSFLASMSGTLFRALKKSQTPWLQYEGTNNTNYFWFEESE